MDIDRPWWNHWLFILALLYYAVRARNILWFTPVNPGILGSGIRGDSKYETLRRLRNAAGAKWERAVPTTIRITRPVDKRELEEAMRGGGNWERTDRRVLHFPVIAKPDLGANGWRVHRVKNMEDLVAYMRGMNGDWLIQECIEGTEVNVFYHRHPTTNSGTVSDIARKEFWEVIGDGSRTLREHMEQRYGSDEERRISLEAQCHQEFGDVYGEIALDDVVPKGKKVALGPPGNSHLWRRIIDETRLVDHHLNEMLDDLSLRFEDGFYYGTVVFVGLTWHI
ncbi:hypothetical protein VKT23_004597 [Stygiomarasmius scandens]|uniref:ATP-grasp domain-containing protein n=1 Tax=Marasmiellus scandens TaxID=2682957 RepID=A0ABR1JWH1_9AGAR